MSERPQTKGEEIANSTSHGLALLAAIVSLPVLITHAHALGTIHLIGASVFAATMVLLYTTSTLYHALPNGGLKRVLLKLDHCAIYIFIAGSYTPFALGALGDSPWGWILFVLVWSFAGFGVTMKAFDRLTHPWLSSGLYLVMGWMVLIAAAPLAERIPSQCIAFLVAGGIAYTVGVAFFILDSRFRFAHTIWHSFVIAGSTFHFFAVLTYVV